MHGHFFFKNFASKNEKNRIQQKLSVLATNHYQKSFHRDESTLCTKFYMDTSTILVKMTKKWPKIGKILKCRLTGRLSVDQHHVTCCIENTLLWLSIQLFSYKEASYTLQNDNGRTYMHIIGYFCSISLNLRARYWRL